MMEVCDNGGGLRKDGPAGKASVCPTRGRGCRPFMATTMRFELCDAPGGGLLVRLTLPFQTNSFRMKIRTLIVDDEPLARDRLRQLLQDEPEIELAGECADGHEARRRH